MNDIEILSLLLDDIKSKGITHYAIRRDTGITESTMRRLTAGAGAKILTIVTLADYLGYTIELKKKE